MKKLLAIIPFISFSIWSMDNGSQATLSTEKYEAIEPLLGQLSMQRSHHKMYKGQLGELFYVQSLGETGFAIQKSIESWTDAEKKAVQALIDKINAQ